MGLSKQLQTPEILTKIAGKTFDECRQILFVEGEKYFAQTPEERATIKANLESFGLPSDEGEVQKVCDGVIEHYAEKVFPLTAGPKELAEHINSRIDFRKAKEQIEEALKTGSVLIATPHFGGVECVTPTISFMKFAVNVNAVLKFSTQNLSDKIRSFSDSMEKSGLFSKINFIELGKPNSQGAMEMVKVLGRNEILFSVFDEETPYSKPVDLFGRKVLGGAGLDKLLKFCPENVTIFNVFMTRLGDGKYEMKLMPVETNAKNPIQEMYKNLESVLREHFTQWYFLHEDIAFAD